MPIALTKGCGAAWQMSDHATLGQTELIHMQFMVRLHGLKQDPRHGGGGGWSDMAVRVVTLRSLTVMEVEVFLLDSILLEV